MRAAVSIRPGTILTGMTRTCLLLRTGLLPHLPGFPAPRPHQHTPTIYKAGTIPHEPKSIGPFPGTGGRSACAPHFDSLISIFSANQEQKSRISPLMRSSPIERSSVSAIVVSV